VTGSDQVLIVVHRPDDDGSRFLVLHRAPWKRGYWHLAGGGVEAGETDAEAAVRELDEETGLRAKLVDLGDDLAYDGITVHAFAVEAPVGWEPILNDEHDDHRWCSLREAMELLAYEEPREALRRAARLVGVEA
jgi:8-oxo-dGTP pyrophosphatase MutT (NUDIX family)